MDVVINVFDNELNFCVKPKMYIGKILAKVAKCLNLTKQVEHFGLLGFNIMNRNWIWLNNGQTLKRSINDGLCYDPVIYLYLRVKSFPSTIDRSNPIAMRLFYKQVTQRWCNGYNTSSSSELVLLALVMQIEFGNYNLLKENELQDNCRSFAIAHMNVQKKEKEEVEEEEEAEEDMLLVTDDPNLVIDQVLFPMWKLFDSISVDESIYNYLRLMKQLNFSYETVCFQLIQLPDKHSIDLEIDFNGINILSTKYDNHLKSLSFRPWSMIRYVVKRHRWLKIGFRHGIKLVFQCDNEFMCSELFLIISEYHQCFKKQQKRNDLTRFDFELGNAERFFDKLQNLLIVFNQRKLKLEDEKSEIGLILNRLTEWIEDNQYDRQMLQTVQNNIHQLLIRIKDYHFKLNFSVDQLETNKQISDNLNEAKDDQPSSPKLDEEHFEPNQLAIIPMKHDYDQDLMEQYPSIDSGGSPIDTTDSFKNEDDEHYSISKSLTDSDGCVLI